MKRFSHNIFRTAMLVPLLLCMAFAGTAQVRNISFKGRVIDAATQEPIIGAVAMIDGTATAATTDADGYFALEVPPTAEILISIIGYDPMTIKVGGRSAMVIELKEAVNMLDEAVAIGYGVVKKSELTSSISSVTSKDLNKTVVTSVDQALQGNAAGVLVINTSGEPGGDVTMRIRGSSSIQGDNEPLIVIDGIPSENSVLSTLPPSDVESIEVLKDASATAIYGSRGANGVVMITTKSGHQGKAKVTVDIKETVNTPRKYLDLMDAPQHARYANLGLWAFGENKVASLDPYSIQTYDLQHELIRGAVLRQDYSLSVTGGSKLLNYYVSGTYYDEDGLVKNSGSNRLALRAKFNIQASEKVSIMVSTNISRRNIDKIGGGSGGALLQAAIINPRTNPDGTFQDGMYIDEETGEILSTNAQLAAALNRINRNSTFNSGINGTLTWKITKDLVFNTSGALNYDNSENYLYTPRYIYTNYDTIVKNNKAERNTNNSLRWNNFNTLTYSKTLGRHSFSVMAAAEFSGVTNEGHGGVARLFNTDYYQWNNLNAASYMDKISSSKSEYNMVSFFGRGSYNYDNRYLATVTFRADGSSRFGEDSKFGYFPSASFAWNAKNEKFLKKVRWLSNMKVRLSWGITGNDKIGQYKSQSLLSAYKILIDGAPYTGMGTDTMIGNPDLQWETTYQYNLGMDIGFFKNRLSLTLDLYNKDTHNLLYTYTLPRSSGYQTVMSNIGHINNKGVEIEVTSRNIVKKYFSWTTNLALGFNRNKVVDLGGNDMVAMYNLADDVQKDVTYLKTSYPIGVFMGYKTSIYKNWDEVYDDSSVWLEDGSVLETRPGMIRYKDLDGNGYIDDNDREVLGQAEPKLTGGFTNTFTYRNIDLTVFIVGAYGGSVMNANSHRLRKFKANGINQMGQLLDVYRPINSITGDPGYSGGKYPVPIPGENNNYTSNITDYWIEDASYLRLKSLSLAYHFQQKVFRNNRKMPLINIAFTATNLVTLTRYTGYDPEMSSTQGTANDRLGIDFSSYPAPMGFTVGLNITF